MRAAGCGLRATDCIAGCGLQVTDCGLRVAGHRLRAAGCGPRSGCGPQIAGCGLQATIGLRAAGHRLRAAGHMLWIAKIAGC